MAELKDQKDGMAQERELQETLRKVYNVLISPNSKGNVDALQKNVNNSSPGRSVLWKKFTGALLIFLGVAVIGLSIAGIPFSAGLSSGGIAGGALLIAAGGLFYKAGMQKGLAKQGATLVKVAKSNFIQNE